MNAPNDTPTSHTHVSLFHWLHATEHLTRLPTASKCLHTIFAGKATCHLFSIYSYTQTTTHCSFERFCFICTDTSFCVCEMCGYLYRNKCTTLISGSDKDCSMAFKFFFFCLKCSFMPPGHLTRKSPENQHVLSLKVPLIWCLPRECQISAWSLLER